MKAAVTGGTGFIGGKLVRRLIEQGYEVKCLVRRTSDYIALKQLGVELVFGDLGNLESLKHLPGECDLVFHLAALVTDWGTREEFQKFNVEPTRCLLEASIESGVKRFVYLSSSTVVWNSDFWHTHNLENIDESYPYPESYNDHYNQSKADAERLVLNFQKTKGLETVCIRPSNVWGAGDTVILPRIANAALKGILIPMGSGKRWVSPSYIDNLVDGIYLAANSNNAPGNIYFINDGLKIDHMEFLSMMLNASGVDWTPRYSIPYKLAYIVGYILELIGKIKNSKTPPLLTRFAVSALAGSRSYNIDNAKKDLGYEPKIDLNKGLELMEKWIGEVGGIEKLIELKSL